MTAKDQRNPGMPLDLDWVSGARCQSQRDRAAYCNSPWAAFREKGLAGSMAGTSRYLYRPDNSAGGDTPGRVKRLCAKARQPIRPDMLAKLGLDGQKITVGAVCVYPNRVKDAVDALHGTDIPVASVATGFPAGQTPLPQRIAEIEQAIEAGAKEIDIVIPRNYVLTGNWQALYDEIQQFRRACGQAAHMKTILATGDLGTLKQVYQASLVAMMAGSDFIKTSTGYGIGQCYIGGQSGHGARHSGVSDPYWK